MTTDQAAADAKKPDDKTAAPAAATVGDLRNMVAEVVEKQLQPFLDKLTGGGQAAAPQSGGQAGAGLPDIGKMVDEAVAKVTGQRDQAAADAEHARQHEILAAAAERRPVDRPRRSRWLGNIWDQ